ncbi:PTS fructose transporter subunit IIA [Geobacillus sp. MR]|jgi:mannose/fructose/sorbose-specific phosphotransferase system IIA component|uniref:PTS sugar transporter subunit IIA n=1 Tax=Geobacillus sp. MR TaxID=2508875 RepID=UPI00148D1A7F|nr:PTS fructose transporter subunit IIA [Geobacillus sp. MR]NNU88111.1 PTS fructose transporter subunit IIA [Geobacillus sp. MR]
MKAILLTSHGQFCEGLFDAVQMILGETPHLYTLALDDKGVEHFSHALNLLIDELNQKYDSLLIFCDLKGGTPYNQSLKHVFQSDGNIKILTGMNLPMILEVYPQLETTDLDDLVQKASEIGKQAITGINEFL